MRVKLAIRPKDAILIYIIAVCVYSISGVLASLFVNGGNAAILLGYALPQAAYILTTLAYFGAVGIKFGKIPRENFKIRYYLLALLCLFGLFFLSLFPNYGMRLLFERAGIDVGISLPEFRSPADFVSGAIIIAVLPAIGEELVFRKNFCDAFADCGIASAAALSGFVFALSHFNLAQTVYQFFFGCVLAYIYMKTGNITINMLLHCVNNLFALFLPTLTGESVWSDFTALGASLVAGAVVFVAAALLLRKFGLPAKREKKEKLSSFSAGFLIIFSAVWLTAVIVGAAIK